MKSQTSKLEFLRYVVSVDVDGLRGISHYTIKAMYNEIHPEDYATITHKLIDEFDYSWDEIERDGGLSEINRQLKECYGDYWN